MKRRSPEIINITKALIKKKKCAWSSRTKQDHYIWSRIRNWIIVDQWWNELAMRWSTCQYNAETDCILQQEHTKCWKNTHHHWEALWILHGLEMFHHYCFVIKISIIMNHKPLAAIFKKDVATLSQKLQCILLRIHQCRIKMLYKPGSDLFIPDWLSWQNHKEDKDSEIFHKKISIDIVQTAVDTPECMSIQDIQWATLQDDHCSN